MSKRIKELWIKFSSFLEREMSVTLIFWLVIFSIVLILKILGLVGK